MSERFKKQEKFSKKIDPYDFDHLSASSATDCTGLIPAAPDGEGELEAYEEIYPFRPQVQIDKNKNAKFHTNP